MCTPKSDLTGRHANYLNECAFCIGGMAIALVVQSILSDLLASLAISLDKPFETGDFIVFGDIVGNAEQIGPKPTRIRSQYS
jgi:small-conductance mechanosensitive channel